MVILMLERLEIGDLGGLGFIINPLVRTNCYKFLEEWTEENFETVYEDVVSKLNIDNPAKDKELEGKNNGNILFAIILICGYGSFLLCFNVCYLLINWFIYIIFLHKFILIFVIFLIILRIYYLDYLFQKRKRETLNKILHNRINEILQNK